MPLIGHTQTPDYKEDSLIIASCQFPISSHMEENAAWILNQMREAHDSLYVIDPTGRIVDRYDKRFCTKGDLDYFYMSLTNSSAASSWPCHFITPDGMIQEKLTHTSDSSQDSEALPGKLSL